MNKLDKLKHGYLLIYVFGFRMKERCAWHTICVSREGRITFIPVNDVKISDLTSYADNELLANELDQTWVVSKNDRFIKIINTGQSHKKAMKFYCFAEVTAYICQLSEKRADRNERYVIVHVSDNRYYELISNIDQLRALENKYQSELDVRNEARKNVLPMLNEISGYLSSKGTRNFHAVAITLSLFLADIRAGKGDALRSAGKSTYYKRMALLKAGGFVE